MMIGDISIEIITKAKELFSDKQVMHGMRLARVGKVVISYQKTVPDRYYIASALIKDDRSYETQIHYKNENRETPEGPIKSLCNCHLWRNQEHCPHVCALFLQYHLELAVNDQLSSVVPASVNSIVPPTLPISGFTVNVAEYGKIVHGPHKLQGAATSATYYSHKYLLHSGKSVSFSIPQDFVGKLIINIKALSDVSYLESVQTTIYFAYKATNGEIVKHISLLEHQYLYNWLNGDVWHLPHVLKDFIIKIKTKYENLEINEALSLAAEAVEQELLEVYVEDRPLYEYPTLTTTPEVHLDASDRKGFLDLSIIFRTSSDTETPLAPLPRVLAAFTFQGGLLGSFTKKQDSYSLLKGICDTLEHGVNHYARHLLFHTKKEEFSNLLDHLFTSSDDLAFDFKTGHLCTFKNKFLIAFITRLYMAFGENAYRFSTVSHRERVISYQISTDLLNSGLSVFHNLLTTHGVAFFYAKKSMQKWKSGIQFERKNISGGWFDLELTLTPLEMEIVQKAELEHGIAMTSSGMILLTDEQKELLQQVRHYIKNDSSGVVTDEDGKTRYMLPFNRMRIFELFQLKKWGMEGALNADEEALCNNLMSLTALPSYPIPLHLENVLRPYQTTGYNWLRFLFEHKLGACLADDMGLGKTLQTIAFLSSIYDQIKRVLIICPVTILLNWEKEIQKFSQMELYIYHGGTRSIPVGPKIILSSYGLLKKEADIAFATSHFDILILDEVQQLKNIRSLGAYSARKIKSDFKICLTGTPVENDLSEFYNIIDLAVPGIWGDIQHIRSSSNKKSRFSARKVASPFILRRTKSQVLQDLPPKIENTVYLEFSTIEKNSYLEKLVTVRENIKLADKKVKYGEILKGLLQLRQTCLWQKMSEAPQDEEESSIFFPCSQIASSKVKFLIETLESIIEEGHQAIVFSQFTTYLDYIQSIVIERNWSHSRIDGSQSIKKRQLEVDKFQAHQSSVFLISLKAGGVGLNLTAASYVFIMDPWWNPAVENQAIDRAHRIGQENKLTVYRPIIKDSVEEKVLKLQEWKRELFKDLLPEDEQDLFTGKLSMKDFANLLSFNGEEELD